MDYFQVLPDCTFTGTATIYIFASEIMCTKVYGSLHSTSMIMVVVDE